MYVPVVVAVPEIAPVAVLMLSPAGSPVALHAPVAAIVPVPAVAVAGMLFATSL